MSEKIETKDIAAFIDVTDDGSGQIHVIANLQVRKPDDENFVKLSKGDALRATYDGGTRTMKASGASYEASFPVGDDYVVGVGFDREKFEDALSNVGEMPDAVEIGDFYDPVSRDLDSIIIDLPETFGTKDVRVDGWCISSQSWSFGEEADVLYISPGDLYASNEEDECTVTITITTSTVGKIDPALHSESSFHLQAERSATFTSVP